MSFLRGSANYVWCTTSILGKGATGAVFQGVNKNNGEPVAVKTFNQLSHMRPHEVQIREFEVLNKVKHENIVKLLAIEEEQEGRGKVIVMELCTGGSLFNILDDPENTYGLKEKEFLLVVEHLSAGMKHLRDNNIVHRDLKPGNIMKFINDDGAAVYKLTDFGAARELEEDQQFVSLYGTEEYLHPDMYERAVLRRPVGKTFGATVDLWSIGVTLYHVATGNLPFRPFGGRKNKETMFYITTRKASGVISGTQTTENGHIDWSRELPPHCQLSAGLKKIITPLLAGLLEADPDKIWSFDRFFSEVQERLGCVPVHIFYVNRASSIKVLLKPEDCLKNLQYQICEQTEILPNNQILLYKDQLVHSAVEETTPGRSFPPTSEEEPLMLFSRNNNTCCSIGLSCEKDVPKFPVFPNLVSVENDASQAKVACSVGHVIKRRVEMLSEGSRLSGECVKHWSTMIRRIVASLYSRSTALAALTVTQADTAKLLDFVTQNLLHIRKTISPSEEGVSASKWSQEFQSLNEEMLAGWTTPIRQLHAKYVSGDMLQSGWSGATQNIRCPHKHRLPYKAKTLVDKLRDSWQHLMRDRTARSLTYNDEQFHALERVKVTEAGRSARSLLDQDCSPNAALTAEALEDWYKGAQTVYLQSQILDKDLTSADSKLKSLGDRMKEAIQDVKEQLDLAVKQISILEKDKDRVPRRCSNSNESGGSGDKEEGAPDREMETKKLLLEENQAVHIGLKNMFSIQEELAAVLAHNTQIISCLYYKTH